MWPLILIGIFSLASASLTPYDISAVVDNVIAHGNEIITSNGFRNISLPDVFNGNLFVKRQFFTGSLEDLATFRRIGEANVTTKSQGTMTQYSIETAVGLESLEVAYRYHINILWIFQTSGFMRVTVKKNSAMAKADLVTDTNGGDCALLSKDLDVLTMDDIDVTIQEGGFMGSIIAQFVKLVLRFFLPNLVQVVNSELDEFNENYPVSPEITQYVCQFFV